MKPVHSYRPIATLQEFRERFVYLAEEDAVFDLQAPNSGNATLKCANFLRTYAHSTMLVPGGTPKRVGLAKVWLADPARIAAYGRYYNPLLGPGVFEDRGQLWVNSFWMPTWERVRDKAIAKPFLDHMALLVPDKVEREIVLDWFAHLMQHPGKRQRWALMMVAKAQGTGRGWVVELIKRLLGEQNVKPFSMKEFDSDFDDAFVECLLNAVEEVKESTEGKYVLGEKLKDRITMRSTVANLKYGAKRLMNIYSSLLLQSNHPDAIVLRDEDRRVMVVSTDTAPRDDAYYSSLYSRLDDERFLAAVATLLLSRDLSAFRSMQRAPRTEAKRAMISATTSEADDFVESFLDTCPHPYFTAKQVARFAMKLKNEHGTDVEAPKTNQLGAILLHKATRVAGLPGNSVKHKSEKVRPWHGPRLNGAAKPRDLPEAVRKSLEAVDAWLVPQASEAAGNAVLKWRKSRE